MSTRKSTLKKKNASKENVGLCNSFEKSNTRIEFEFILFCVKSKYEINWGSWDTEMAISKGSLWKCLFLHRCRRQCSRQTQNSTRNTCAKRRIKNNKTSKISLLTTLSICVHGENKKKSQVVDEQKLSREHHFVPVTNSDNTDPATTLR